MGLPQSLPKRRKSCRAHGTDLSHWTHCPSPAEPWDTAVICSRPSSPVCARTRLTPLPQHTCTTKTNSRVKEGQKSLSFRVFKHVNDFENVSPNPHKFYQCFYIETSHVDNAVHTELSSPSWFTTARVKSKCLSLSFLASAKLTSPLQAIRCLNQSVGTPL